MNPPSDIEAALMRAWQAGHEAPSGDVSPDAVIKMLWRGLAHTTDMLLRNVSAFAPKEMVAANRAIASSLEIAARVHEGAPPAEVECKAVPPTRAELVDACVRAIGVAQA